MQGSTHLVIGVFIQKILRKAEPVSLRYFLTAFLAFISHGFLDRLARFTYHPSTLLFEDPFWTVYHLAIVLLSVFIVVKYWEEYKIGMGFSMLPDLDWVIIHASSFFSFQISFWSGPVIHNLLNFLDFLPPFKYLNSLPDLSLRREGVILECGMLSILVFLTHILDRKTKNDVRMRGKTSIIGQHYKVDE
ncbi:MAG: hypothetical protein QXI36_06045 [Candidatus Bathyarchaeia archaeon]